MYGRAQEGLPPKPKGSTKRPKKKDSRTSFSRSESSATSDTSEISVEEDSDDEDDVGKKKVTARELQEELCTGKFVYSHVAFATILGAVS